MPPEPGPARFALCIAVHDFPVSLEARKVYRVIDDPAAEGRGLVRVIDESGEDYLYPRELFVPVDLPAAAVAVLLAADAA